MTTLIELFIFVAVFIGILGVVDLMAIIFAKYLERREDESKTTVENYWSRHR